MCDWMKCVAVALTIFRGRRLGRGILIHRSGGFGGVLISSYSEIIFTGGISDFTWGIFTFTRIVFIFTRVIFIFTRIVLIFTWRIFIFIDDGCIISVIDTHAIRIQFLIIRGVEEIIIVSETQDYRCRRE